MSADIRPDLALLHHNLLRGQLPRTLSWSDTVALIGEVGVVQCHGSDDFVFLVGTQRAFFKRPRAHELAPPEVARLRHFLRDARPAEQVETPGRPSRMTIVIDHYAAHVYQDLSETRRPDEATTDRYDPFRFHHHLIHRREAHYSDERMPEEASFYEDVAKSMLSANEIILIGPGTGKSSAVEDFIEYLKLHHPAVSQHVLATRKVDLSALTEPQVEEIAIRHMLTLV